MRSSIQVRIHIEPLDERRLSRPEMLTVLRGQLALLCRRCEEGEPVALGTLQGCERIARCLELEELTA
jgi:hypothetical protein